MTSSSNPKTPQEATIRRIRGTSLPLTTAAARAAAGETAWAELLLQLSPPARALVTSPPSRETWVDAALLAELMTLFTQAGDLGAVPATLGAETSRARFPEAFRTPETLVAALPRFWSASLDGGVLETEVTGPGSAAVRLWAIWDVPLYSFDGHLPAWFAHALRLSGAQNPSVRYLPPTGPDGFFHVYQLQWG